MDPAALRTQAWALKDRCYAAWSAEPAAAAVAADELAALAATTADAEVHALAAWTAGIVHVTQGRMADAVTAFDDAQAGLDAAGRVDRAPETQVPKIMALSMLGRLDEAAACAASAARALRASGNLAAAGRVSLNLGSLQMRRDAYADAVPHYREAAVLFARTGDRHYSVTADIGLADALAAMGDFDEARRIYARARMRAGTHGLGLPLAIADESLALLDLAHARYRDALAGFESARRRYERLDMPQYLAVAEKQLADAYLELNLLPEALALLDRAVAEFERQECRPEQAWALLQQGRARVGLDRHADAAASFAAAAALFDGQQNAVGAATVALAQAELALALREPVAALAHAQAALLAFDGAQRPDGAARAGALVAQALLAAGRRSEAAAAFAAALERARAQQQPAVQVRCLVGQGLLAQAAGERTLAARHFDAAIELADDLRRALPGDELRAAFLTDHLRPYQERLRLALQDGDAAEVLGRLEQFRARALDERLAEAPDPEGRRQRLAWLYRRVRRLQEEADGSDVLSDELRRTERDLLEAVRRQRLADGGAPAEAAAFAPQALQQALGPDDALVEFGKLDDEIFAVVVRPQGLQLLRAMASRAVVLEALRAFRFQVDALRHGTAPVAQHLPVLTRRAELRLGALRTLLWQPLEAALAGARRVLVVPQGALGAVPFGAFDGDRLVALAPSARVALRGLAQAPAVPRRVLALGESQRLPQAAVEAQAVAARFPQGRALVGPDATLAALQTGCAGVDVLHLACHASFRADNPRFSALHLADAPLTVDAAEALDLQAATVVLSACETGVSDSGDEMVGLARAFLVAGAARVVASLWPVDDAVAARLMGRFYGALHAGVPVAAALQQAQAELKQDLRHPHFWGAFMVLGGF